MSGRRRPFPPDPDFVDRVLRAIVPSIEVDATLLVEMSADEILRTRLRQKLLLSRHGRVDFHSWEHRDVAEMHSAYGELLDIVERENARS